MTRTFRTAAHRYADNHRDSISAAARHAIIETPYGGEEPGVILVASGKIRLALTLDGAHRLAKDIADRLTEHRAQARP